MLLESLLTLVEELRGRIETHGNSLRQSEALTRYALIDPLLRELGWDTEDPDMVVPEYRSAAGSADYALFSGNNQPPAVIVEAKKLGERLGDGVALQSVNYCNLVGTPYFALTDGRIWKIYATFEQAPLADRLIAEFTIGGMNAADVSIKALALWRHNVASGSISPAQTPIAGVVSDALADVAQPAGAVSVAEPAPVVAQPAPTINVPQKPVLRESQSDPAQASAATIPPSPMPGAATDGWQPLSDTRPNIGDPNPRQMMLPDNSVVAIPRWNWVGLEVFRWLTNNGHLGDEDVPIPNPHNESRYIVADQPIHPKGNKFIKPQEVSTRYVEMGGVVFPQAAENARSIIKLAGMDASQFKLRW